MIKLSGEYRDNAQYITAGDGGGAGFPYSKLITRTLYLQVFDYDRFSRDDPIGEVCLPLAEVDLSNVQTMWKTLQPCKGHVVSLTVALPVCRCRVAITFRPTST